jgi:hypothetical protein
VKWARLLFLCAKRLLFEEPSIPDTDSCADCDARFRQLLPIETPAPRAELSTPTAPPRAELVKLGTQPALRMIAYTESVFSYKFERQRETGLAQSME